MRDDFTDVIAQIERVAHVFTSVLTPI